MPRLNVAVTVTAAVLLLAIAGTVFRVSTAPDRIRERREAARATCLANGGNWVMHDGREACRKNGEWLP